MLELLLRGRIWIKLKARRFKEIYYDKALRNAASENLQVLTETDLPPPAGKGTLDVRLARDREYFLA